MHYVSFKVHISNLTTCVILIFLVDDYQPMEQRNAHMDIKPSNLATERSNVYEPDEQKITNLNGKDQSMDVMIPMPMFRFSGTAMHLRRRPNPFLRMYKRQVSNPTFIKMVTNGYKKRLRLNIDYNNY